jgi:hypothetical protein
MEPGLVHPWNLRIQNFCCNPPPRLPPPSPPTNTHNFSLQNAQCTRSLDHHILKVHTTQASKNFFFFFFYHSSLKSAKHRLNVKFFRPDIGGFHRSAYTQYVRSVSAHSRYKQSLTLWTIIRMSLSEYSVHAELPSDILYH